MCNCILKMLRIKDENIKLDNDFNELVYRGKLTFCYYGTLTYNPERCVNCGFTGHIQRHGYRKVRIKLPKVSEQHACLILKKQRFFCTCCNSTFVAETDVVDKHCFISNNTKLAITDKVTEMRTNKNIARSCNVSEHTVSRTINQVAKHLYYKPLSSLPENIMMDEFKSVKNVDGAMSFIYCDSESHSVIDILPDRRKYELIKYFLRFELAERKKVKTVTIDMYEPYMQLIKDVFPNAKIIIDKFHLIQAVNREINKTRVKSMNLFRIKNRPLYNKFKRYWKLLLKDPYELSNANWGAFKLFKNWTSPKQIVNYLIEKNEVLKATHQIGHDIVRCIRNKQFNHFKNIIESKSLPLLSAGLRTVIRTFKRYLNHIENTFNYPYTNGPIEGINNKIKVLKRIAYGYRNFYNFRNRILIISRLYKNEPTVKYAAA